MSKRKSEGKTGFGLGTLILKKMNAVRLVCSFELQNSKRLTTQPLSRVDCYRNPGRFAFEGLCHLLGCWAACEASRFRTLIVGLDCQISVVWLGLRLNH